ncbi:MAG: ABC transporter ATP-binding protein/permease [Clostridia bacterium]|nr:ABC transporter ATP-binding protein/permease [Clostridia bacterium]
MLQLKKISKQYKTGDLVQIALNDVSLNFRDNEFVSILGPSGSGKTTLLNIIGGLDRYDDGDLVINNISTKRYKDRDWDSYRNHTIGFVFQSYNLIPHQTILSNVELALTIGGISKRERRKRAIDALEKVGLKEQAHKRPNQMSGGQMQRVAIARALVNNPDILLADEPTGALDTQTSLNIMELLKQVADDRLVIMVTHNPELAGAYSTRIVNLRDGKIIGDTNPFISNEKEVVKPKHKNLGKTSMSMFTAFTLSLNNLLTKKGRTILTSFAGSIGIIGIALILSLSTGFQNYINKVQEDTLTSYPLTVTSETADTTSMLLSMVEKNDEETGKDGVIKETQNMANMFSKIGKNDLKSFKNYLDENQKTVDEMVSFTQYLYDIKPLIYTKNNKQEITRLNPSTLISNISGSSNSMLPASNASVFNEMIDEREIIESQYKVLAGNLPEKYDEVMLILPDPNSISDLLLYSLGLRESKELEDMISKVLQGEEVQNDNIPLEFSYKDLMDIQLKLLDATSTYRYNDKYKVYESMTEDEDFMESVYHNALNLKIVGIVCPKDNSNSISLMSGIAYTKDLTRYVIEEASKSEIVKKQLANGDINVFSNKSFEDDDKASGLDFKDMISIDKKALESAFGGKISENDIKNMTQGYMNEISSSITADTEKAEKDFKTTLGTLTKNLLNDYIDKNQVAGIASIKGRDVDSVVDEFLKTESSKELLSKMESDYIIPQDTFSTMYTNMIKGFLTQYISISSAGSGENEQTNQNENMGEVGGAVLVKSAVNQMVETFVNQEAIAQASKTIAVKMTEAAMQKNVLSKVGELTSKLMKSMASAFKVDEKKIASAFKFNLDEDEMKRLIETMYSKNATGSAKANLSTLGYQDIEEPSSISFYFKDFQSKEKFIDFLDNYNKKMENEDEEKVIKYTDITGTLMSSVKVIVDSVSYVLIAFVSISLIVSSIMIGIITYISVLERTKEIGVLRAIGASKRNISSIFNAETFIVGLFAGICGILITTILLFPINKVINTLTGNLGITAVLPVEGAIALVILSVILTLIGGLIPSKQATKKDPVLALRNE